MPCKPYWSLGFRDPFKGNLWFLEGGWSDIMIIEAIRASGRGAKATQEGLLETIRGYWSLLDLMEMTWLPLSRLCWLV